MLDELDARDVEYLVRMLSKDSVDADELLERIERLLDAFPPTESSLQRLRRMYDEANHHGEHAFCITALYTATLYHLRNKAPRYCALSRSASAHAALQHERSTSPVGPAPNAFSVPYCTYRKPSSSQCLA